jgi:hypothetical protein
LVTALGEESFTDENGDGEWDDGEAFEDLTEAFLDDNEDGVYTPRNNSECLKLGVGPEYDACLLAGDEEEFVDYNSNGSFDTANGVFDGLSCDLAAGAFCSSSLLNVRDSLVIILSPSDDIYTAVVDLGTGAHLPDGSGVAAGGSYLAYFSDIYNNRPAAGATITIAASGDCTILTQASFTVPDSNRLGAYAVGFNVGSDGVVDPGDDTVSVSVANPGGVTNTQTFACTP